MLNNVTFELPRFLSFIELGYLLEAAKVADNQFNVKIEETNDNNTISNINATRQSLLRSIFISSYAILEQQFDELVVLACTRNDLLILPSDLKDRGITRSITYLKKVLKKELNEDLKHWKDLSLLQEVRNHLVHYGAGFNETPEHIKRYKKFSVPEYVSVLPTICFNIEQIENTMNLYMVCMKDFNA